MKKIFYSGLALLLFGAATTKAQDTVETTIGTDFVSSYVWRGMELGDVSMQPALGVSYKGLSLSAWGSVGLLALSWAVGAAAGAPPMLYLTVTFSSVHASVSPHQ